MRAAVFNSSTSPLTVEVVPDPIPKKGQMILEVAHAGVCGSDLHMKEYGLALPGTVFGHEFAGTIVDIGEGVTGWSTGDRVCALPLDPCNTCDACNVGLVGLCYTLPFTGTSLERPGAYAEYVSVSASLSQKLPSGVSFIEGAMVEPLAVAHHAVELGGVDKDSVVLVIGAGPIGAGVTLFTRMKGARHVIVSERSAARRELAMSLGATAVIDPSTADVKAAFRQMTGQAPNIVFECVGIPGLLKEAIANAGVRARVVVAGTCMLDDSYTPSIAQGHELSIQFSQCYTERDFEAVIDAIAQGRVDVTPMHSRTVSLADLPAAFDDLSRGPTSCKTLIDPKL